VCSSLVSISASTVFASTMRLLLALAAVSLAVASNVVVLTPDNFDSVIDGSKHAFVEFYAPWCGHCKNLEPEYEIIADAFAGVGNVVIAKVDADAHRELGTRFGVSGFPTLKFFEKGGSLSSPLAYEGGRSADDIISYVNGKAGSRARVKKAPTAVTVLDESNFASIALDPTKNVLVEFYAPWCGHCKHLAPDYEKVAQAFAAEPDVVVANFDADAHKDTPPKYGVSGFPTIKWFGKKNKANPDSYDGPRDVQSFVDYINEHSGTARNAQGRLGETAGRIPALDALAARFVEAGADQAAVVAEAEAFAKDLTGNDAKSAAFYLKAFGSVQKRGQEHVSAETARLDRLLEGSVSPAKVDEFTVRKNIISSFAA